MIGRGAARGKTRILAAFEELGQVALDIFRDRVVLADLFYGQTRFFQIEPIGDIPQDGIVQRPVKALRFSARFQLGGLLEKNFRTATGPHSAGISSIIQESGSSGAVNHGRNNGRGRNKLEKPKEETAR